MQTKTFVSPTIAAKLQKQIDELISTNSLRLIQKSNPAIYIDMLDCSKDYTLEELQIHLLEHSDLTFSVAKLILNSPKYNYRIQFYFDMNCFLENYKYPFLEADFDNSNVIAYFFVQMSYDVPEKAYTHKQVSISNLYNMIGYCYSLNETDVLNTIGRHTPLHLDMCYQIHKEFFQCDGNNLN